jgi:hypothetical protein
MQGFQQRQLCHAVADEPSNHMAEALKIREKMRTSHSSKHASRSRGTKNVTVFAPKSSLKGETIHSEHRGLHQLAI